MGRWRRDGIHDACFLSGGYLDQWGTSRLRLNSTQSFDARPQAVNPQPQYWYYQECYNVDNEEYVGNYLK